MKPPYPVEAEEAMQNFYRSLGERQRRLYAAAEAAKLGRGGIAYLAHLFHCDEKTIRRGRRELATGSSLPAGRSRKKGGAGHAA